MNTARQTCPIFASEKQERHRAGVIVADAQTIFENAYIETCWGRIAGIHKGRPPAPFIDHGPGVLLPPFVNAHLHLELSALHGQVPLENGFQKWVAVLLEKRQQTGTDTLTKAARAQAVNLVQSGNLYIADISTLGIIRPFIKKTQLSGICFTEYLGRAIPEERLEKSGPLSFSLAGHAPHTSSPELLKHLKQKTVNAGLPMSLHLAESDDETRFIQSRAGDWADFLTARGIDWENWPSGGKSPVVYAHNLGLLDHSTLAVHLLNTNADDLNLIRRQDTKVCVCPRSNFILHGRLPDIPAMLDAGIKPALGTDSLVSSPTLNIRDEMAFTARHFPMLSDEVLFTMGTLNGARALNLQQETGTLVKGRSAIFQYLPICAPKNRILQRIIHNE